MPEGHSFVGWIDKFDWTSRMASESGYLPSLCHDFYYLNWFAMTGGAHLGAMVPAEAGQCLTSEA